MLSQMEDVNQQLSAQVHDLSNHDHRVVAQTFETERQRLLDELQPVNYKYVLLPLFPLSTVWFPYFCFLFVRGLRCCSSTGC